MAAETIAAPMFSPGDVYLKLSMTYTAPRAELLSSRLANFICVRSLSVSLASPVGDCRPQRRVASRYADSLSR